ncbi:MAG: class I SAM-dependent methyltransferase [Candidatus Competibacter sp.]|nr:class I SAM-dependent methyltransferase [Candidatus Competibacter sp.]
MIQDDVFFQDEGDAWFCRNRKVLNKNRSMDWPLMALEWLGNAFQLKSVIELGCSNGWRLAKLADRITGRLVGIDASAQAIANGKESWPALDLRQGLLSNLPVDETFDVVIVNFVLHWVDRKKLAGSIAEIDRVTADNGILLLGDFLPDYCARRRYHHRPELDMYTYKQDYPAIFESLGTYKTISRFSFDHDHPSSSLSLCSGDTRGMISILHKSLDRFYVEVT